MRVLIAGAGVGGLALATGLLADGHDVRVWERAPRLREGGAAVTIAGNGAAALAGLGTSLDGLGGTIDELVFRDDAGRVISRFDMRVMARRTGFCTTTVSREQLVSRLAEGLPDGVVTFDRNVDDVVTVGTRVTVRAGGHTGHADVVVGADGQGSAVRRANLDPTPAADVGWATWQGMTRTVPELAGSRVGTTLVGEQGLVGLMPAGQGLLQWWFDVPWDRAAPGPRSPVDLLRERFAGYWGPVPRLLEDITDADTTLYPHVLHRIPDRWGVGPVTLLGDAAHAFPPSQAQGANQALEDAWVLRRMLGREGSATAAVRDYESTRLSRVRSVSRLASTQVTNRPPGRLARKVARLVPPAVAGRAYHRLVLRWSDVLSSAAPDRP